ncbi:hypothetical protein HAHE_22360 [Haloferula helveola]|uniref:VanZ family protein n=2 Tax=Haloferula helveola TaxID=490095 RepID=A0ABN6H5D7_9BACT|nr:hypothetical protein HAHE_22360 [Haloferula helveola]
MGKLVLAKGPEGSPVVEQLLLPGIDRARSLHMSFQLAAKELAAGKEPREDGRLTLVWLRPDGSNSIEATYLASVLQNLHNRVPSLVSSRDGSPAIPALRVEHLGISGQLELSDLRVSVVRESWSWACGKYVLVVSWLAWAGGVAGGLRFRSWRPWLVGIAWVVLLIRVVLPGPWPNDRPLGEPFRLGSPVTDPAGSTPPAVSPQIAESFDRIDLTSTKVGEQENYGGLILRAKLSLQKLRPLLHMLLFLGPSWLFALLTDDRRALALMAAVAVFGEAVQMLFGFGFDFEDLGDLLVDAVGIGIGIGLARLRVFKRFRSRPSEG